MANFNKVILVGRLTRDPELQYTPQQTPVCQFGLAVNQRSKGRDEACFVDCVAWEKTAENIAQYLRKGSSVLVDGKLTYESWEKDGRKYSKLKVTAYNVQFMDSKPEGQGAPPQGGRQPAPPMGGPQSPPAPPQAGYQSPLGAVPGYDTPPPPDDNPPFGDDIPFD
jgi:single-strand DNA-binding protein